MSWPLNPQSRKPVPTRFVLRALAALLLTGAAFFGAPGADAQDGASDADGAVANVTIHVVQEGETLSAIARTYGVDLATLRAVNNLDGYGVIEVGQRLVIPVEGALIASTAGEPVVVGYGESLYTLAARYRLGVEALAHLNGLANPINLIAGGEIKIPADQPAFTTRRLGDPADLFRAALAADASVYALMQLNSIGNPHLVPPDRLIAVPVGDAVSAPTFAPWASINLHPLPLEQGRTGGLRITTTEPGTVTATFDEREWPVYSDGVSHEALLAVDRWTKPGDYPLTLTFTSDDGDTASITQLIRVADGGYTAEVVRLSEEVAAVMNDPAIVQGELDYVRSSMTGYRPERMWDEQWFRLPAVGVMASGFGTLRSYNGGDYDTFHSGADLSGPTGTPIYAPANGIVVDTGLLDVRGYVTIIDHGRGVYTGYWHQSAILVEPGERVETGQQIGAIGSTGLSTASHLHWEMWVNGVQVDPMQWVRETFP
jgi:murein DD-endopeptidase MepM/ murein hydrolase activator NlpD